MNFIFFMYTVYCHTLFLFMTVQEQKLVSPPRPTDAVSKGRDPKKRGRKF